MHPPGKLNRSPTWIDYVEVSRVNQIKEYLVVSAFGERFIALGSYPNIISDRLT